ncbi:MAG: hypothetical protein QW625_03810 [Candidatus Nanoarchaeia archaeon]
MEHYLELLNSAKKQMELIEHMIYVTYPLVNENKLLLVMLNNIIKCARTSLQSLLEFERISKNISGWDNSFLGEIFIYKQKIEQKYALNPKYFRFLQKLCELEKIDLESNVRFKRGERYILSLANFEKIFELDLNLIKKYASLTKNFIEDILKIIEKK